MSSIEEEGIISTGASRGKEGEHSTRNFVERFKNLFQNEAEWPDAAEKCLEKDKDFKDKVRLMDKKIVVAYMLITLYKFL